MTSKDFRIRTLASAAALLLWTPALFAQNNREFVFDDEEGHLVLRFVGLGPAGMTESQRAEVVNAELSSMVHDHLRADILFETEAVDAEWATATEQHILSNLPHPGTDYADVVIECGSQTCRIRLEQAVYRDISGHRNELTRLQEDIQRLVDADPERFEATYMIAAYEKLRFAPAIKLYLKRSGPGS